MDHQDMSPNRRNFLKQTTLGASALAGLLAAALMALAL